MKSHNSNFIIKLLIVIASTIVILSGLYLFLVLNEEKKMHQKVRSELENCEMFRSSLRNEINTLNHDIRELKEKNREYEIKIMREIYNIKSSDWQSYNEFGISDYFQSESGSQKESIKPSSEKDNVLRDNYVYKNEDIPNSESIFKPTKVESYCPLNVFNVKKIYNKNFAPVVKVEFENLTDKKITNISVNINVNAKDWRATLLGKNNRFNVGGDINPGQKASFKLSVPSKENEKITLSINGIRFSDGTTFPFQKGGCRSFEVL